MAKKVLKIRKAQEDRVTTLKLNEADQAKVLDMISNASLMRADLLSKLIDSRRDIDDECGYPKTLDTQQYKMMYDREGIATRVVSIFPEESWVNDPEIYETDDPKETDFEEAWVTLEQERQLYSYMMKVDELSGIGRFGIMLLGFDDGKTLDQPIEGIDEKGMKVGNAERQLLFVRVFSESEVKIKGLEKDPSNPRFGKPVLYSVSFDSVQKSRTSTGEITEVTSQEQLVHWSRVIHIADNRKSSEVYGTPRMQTLFNRLYDLRKITGGSGEMFWKGGFPGYSFEMDPNAKPLSTTQLDTLREKIADWANGLQRYLTVQGVKVNSLNPQVADPKNHVEVQLEIIAIVLGIPKRIFMGAEQAKLASTQDTEAWNKRVARRQNKYLSPYIIRPLIDRLIAVGVLPEPEEYKIKWPDLAAPSDQDKAEVLAKKVEAFSKYVAGDVNALIPEEIFLSMFVGLTPDEVKEIMDAALKREKELESEAAELEEEEEETTEETVISGEEIEGEEE